MSSLKTKEWILISTILIVGSVIGISQADSIYEFPPKDFEDNELIEFSGNQVNINNSSSWTQKQDWMHNAGTNDNLRIASNQDYADWDSKPMEARKVDKVRVYTEIYDEEKSSADMEVRYIYGPNSLEFYMDFGLENGSNEFLLYRDTDSEYMQLKLHLTRENIDVKSPEISNVTIR